MGGGSSRSDQEESHSAARSMTPDPVPASRPARRSSEAPRSIPEPVFIEDWRKEIEWEERDTILDIAKNYKTEISSVPTVNILLVGAVGSGKTSFFSSIDSAFKGRIAHREESLATRSGDASIPKKLRVLTPGGRKGGYVGFKLCDTMGIEEKDGLDLNDLPYILDGHVPHNYTFDPESPITPQSAGFIESPTLAQKMHCIVYVVDVTKVGLAPTGVKDKFTVLRTQASARNILVVILVTHIDEMCEAVNKSVRNAYRSKAVKDTVYEIHEITGVKLPLIYLAKNYNYEDKLNPDVDVLNLTALQTMLDCADDSLDNFF